MVFRERPKLYLLDPQRAIEQLSKKMSPENGTLEIDDWTTVDRGRNHFKDFNKNRKGDGGFLIVDYWEAPLIQSAIFGLAGSVLQTPSERKVGYVMAIKGRIYGASGAPGFREAVKIRIEKPLKFLDQRVSQPGTEIPLNPFIIFMGRERSGREPMTDQREDFLSHYALHLQNDLRFLLSNESFYPIVEKK